MAQPGNAADRFAPADFFVKGKIVKNANKITYQCCFCGHLITKTTTEPIHIEIKLNDSEKQGLTSHKKCLIKALHPSVPIAIYEND